MREIKFRAWDGTKMLDDVSVQLFVYDGGINEFFAIAADDLVTLMQYTGLKDKNGVEIYEGDRLEYYPDFYDADEPTDRYTVEWRDRGFVGVWDGDKDVKNKGNDGLSDSHIDMVVIGNIYENPYLLKGDS